EEDISNTVEIQSIDCTEAMNNVEDIVDHENLNNKENNENLLLVDITDITNTGHQILRQSACRNLEDYTEKMVNYMSKGKKWPVSYEIGDLVRISIPKIDRFGVDRSKFDVIDICFSAGELDPLNAAEFPELDIIPPTNISVREASRLQ
ncbi:10619_t:CDS:2, partial [Cetraspora pellucida]